MTYLTYEEFYEKLDKVDKIEKEDGPIYAWMFIIIKDNKMSLSVACITGCDERREENDKTYYIYGEHSKNALKKSFINEDHDILGCTYGDITLPLTEEELEKLEKLEFTPLKTIVF